MRYRITVRGEHIELRGYIDGDKDEQGHPRLPVNLAEFAKAMKPFGIVVASPADEHYNPFALDEL